MRLRPGDPAPDFDVLDVHGRKVALRELRGSKVLLCFYRYAGCPFCNLFLHELILSHPQYIKLGLRIVAFFQSPAASVLEFPAKQEPPFPLVADPDKKVYEAYGIESSIMGVVGTTIHMTPFIEAHLKGFPQRRIEGDFFLMPAEFLVREDGTIAAAHYAKHLSDRLAPSDVLRFLAGKPAAS